MKKIKLITLAGTALVGLSQLLWAGPRGGGGGIGGGGHVGGFAGGGHVDGFAGGAHFGGGHVSSYAGGFRAAPLSSGGGARFNGGTVGAVTRTPQQFYYYGGNRTSAVTPHASSGQLANRSIRSTAGRVAAVNRQSNRVKSAVGQKRISATRPSTAENRQSFMKNHAFARHDPNWHRDWDKRRTHFDHGHVFVFIDGFWWGLYPWDYYPYDAYGSYPSDYYGYPYGYNDYPYDSYDYNTQDPYSYYSGYADPAQSGNAVVSSLQSQLAKLGYYRGAVDGVAGDETQAAIARYQEDNDLSVTGTVTAATLQSLGLAGR